MGLSVEFRIGCGAMDTFVFRLSGTTSQNLIVPAPELKLRFFPQRSGGADSHAGTAKTAVGVDKEPVEGCADVRIFAFVDV